MPKVYIIDSSHEYGIMFCSHGWDVVDHMDDADLVQFTGGADVSPHLYNQDQHARTHVNVLRDENEILEFQKAYKNEIPMAGICRGGQFLNVMCGGSLYQHVDNHALFGTHQMWDVEGDRWMPVTSTHHQMMRQGPYAKILGVASEATVCEYMKDGAVKFNKQRRGDDLEVVFYSQQKVLCFQPHPEYMGKGDECQEFYFQLIKEKLCVG